MATVTRSQSKEKKAKPVVRPIEPSPKVKGVKLPTKFEEPTSRFDDFSFLIHGLPKIGKTSLAMQTADGKNNVLFLQFDAPQRAYRRMEIVCTDYVTALKAVRKLEAAAESGSFPYQRVVVDNADMFCRTSQMYVCEKLAIDHPGELDYGKGWDAARQEFRDVVDRLLRLPCGVWFIAHSQWKDVETRDGGEITRLVPRMSAQGEDLINGKVDCTVAYDYDDKNRRVLVLRGGTRVVCGHRLHQSDNPHFIGKDGKPLRSVLAGRNPQQAFRNLLAAFNNEYGAV